MTVANAPSKRCNACGETKALTLFVKDRRLRDGHAAQCLDCRSERLRSYYASHPEKVTARHALVIKWHKSNPDRNTAARRRYLSNHPEQREKVRQQARRYQATHSDEIRARGIVAQAVKRGLLVRPSSCSLCGTDQRVIQGHHDDYSKPLSVRWLCARCHKLHHVNLRTGLEEAS